MAFRVLVFPATSVLTERSQLKNRQVFAAITVSEATSIPKRTVVLSIAETNAPNESLMTETAVVPKLAMTIVNAAVGTVPVLAPCNFNSFRFSHGLSPKISCKSVVLCQPCLMLP